jgi:hypothetical protein
MPGIHKGNSGIQRVLFSRPLVSLGVLLIILGTLGYGWFAWKEGPRKEMDRVEVKKKDVDKSLRLPEKEAPTVAWEKRQLFEDEKSEHRKVTLSIDRGDEDDSTEAIQESSWEELQQARKEFEERVLRETYAARVRVETPSIVRSSAPSSADPGAVHPSERGNWGSAEAEENPGAAPGYVAFMSRPEGFDQGIDQVMEEIAEQYVRSFPDAPRVTVSLIVGGGVRGQGTFINQAGVVVREQP